MQWSEINKEAVFFDYCQSECSPELKIGVEYNWIVKNMQTICVLHFSMQKHVFHHSKAVTHMLSSVIKINEHAEVTGGCTHKTLNAYLWQKCFHL